MLFQIIGKSWLEKAFQKELADFNATKNQELEHLRTELGRFHDRALRFNAVEYEMLPRSWELLKRAEGSVAHCWRRLRQSPDFDRMTEADLEDFLETTDFSSAEKKKIREAQNKRHFYAEIINWNDIQSARNAFIEFNNLLVENDIFFDDELLRHLTAAGGELHQAILLRESFLDKINDDNREVFTQAQECMNKASEEIAIAKNAIRSKLFSLPLFVLNPPAPSQGG